MNSDAARFSLNALSVIDMFCAAAIAVPCYLAGVMAFDAPGSEQNALTWVLSLTTLSIPAWFIVCIVLAWRFYAWGKVGSAFVAAAAPIVITVLGLTMLLRG